MNEAEVKQQIDQMVAFIHQEAREKANEIKLKADEEFNIEKLRMVEGEKQKVRQDYERKEKQVEVQKRIAQSNEVRFSRLKCLKSRDDAMQSLKNDAQGKLTGLTQGSGYAKLLESLIYEALVQLADQKMKVKAVKGQEAACQKAITPAVAKYKEWATKNKDADFVKGIEVTFDSDSLTSGIGGCEVVGHGGLITLTNTLQSRLELAFETHLPALREKLFS